MRFVRVTYTAGVFLDNIESKMGGVVHLAIIASQLMANLNPALSV